MSFSQMALGKHNGNLFVFSLVVMTLYPPWLEAFWEISLGHTISASERVRQLPRQHLKLAL